MAKLYGVLKMEFMVSRAVCRYGDVYRHIKSILLIVLYGIFTWVLFFNI